MFEKSRAMQSWNERFVSNTQVVAQSECLLAEVGFDPAEKEDSKSGLWTSYDEGEDTRYRSICQPLVIACYSPVKYM